MNPALASHSQTATDRELQERVLAALDAELFDAAAIGVTVLHGVVTLQGRVASLEEKVNAERVASAITSVRAVANDLEIVSSDRPDTDSAIAEAAANALTWYRAVPPDMVKVVVSNGHLTLTGVVNDVLQRGAAERVVRGLRGVRAVSNALRVRRPPCVMPEVLDS